MTAGLGGGMRRIERTERVGGPIAAAALGCRRGTRATADCAIRTAFICPGSGTIHVLVAASRLTGRRIPSAAAAGTSVCAALAGASLAAIPGASLAAIPGASAAIATSTATSTATSAPTTLGQRG
jgi:hypothetical protein